MKFSIIIPTYNRAHFIPASLESCLKQTYEDFEVILVDDGSTDHTRALVESYKDPRIKYIHTANVERGAARNIGIKISTGDYVTFLDSDDIYYQNYLAHAKTFIENCQHPAFLHQAFEFINTKGSVIQKYVPFKPIDLLSGNYMACMGVFIRREVVLNNMFDENRILAGSEDYELWLRIYAKHGLQVSPTVCSAMVSHSERSELQIDHIKLQNRVRYMVQVLQNNESIRAKLGRQIHKVISNIYFYEAINLLIAKQRIKSICAFINAFKADRTAFYNKKAYIYIYNFIKIGIFAVTKIN